MWQVREALLRQRKGRSTTQGCDVIDPCPIGSDAQALPRRWSALILRLNDLERCQEQQMKQSPSR